MKKSRFNANDSFRNEGCKKLFLGNLTLFRNLIITVSHTGKYSGVAEIYNICRPDSSSNKISRFCNSAVIDDNLFYLLSDVHSFTFFHYKIRAHKEYMCVWIYYNTKKELLQ